MQPFMTFSCLWISSASMILRVQMSWMFLWRISYDISCMDGLLCYSMTQEDSFGQKKCLGLYVRHFNTTQFQGMDCPYG